MQLISREVNDCISFEDLFLFLFPRHAISVAVEARKIKYNAMRIRQMTAVGERTANLESDPDLAATTTMTKAARAYTSPNTPLPRYY